MFCHDNNTQKPFAWTELNHLLNWSTDFLKLLQENEANLVTLEMMRNSNSELTISLARHHVREAINFVAGLLNFEFGLDIQHPDTRGLNYASSCVLVEESSSVFDIVRQVFTHIYCKCVVCLVVKTNSFNSAILAAFIVDLAYKAGASQAELKCLAFDRRESIGNEKFTKCQSPASKASKLSTIAAVFNQTDTFAAAQAIQESYFREQYQNLIVLVEESVYERFVLDWQRYYSHALEIGHRFDNRTTVVRSFIDKLFICLAAIDIKRAHKMSGPAINVLKFRTISELLSMLANLRKIPFMSVWNDDDLLARDLCTRINICNVFWINHVPRSVVARGRKVMDEMLNYYADLVVDDMANIYNSIYAEFGEDVEQLRKLHGAFMKKEANLRQRLVCQAFVSLISRCKSLRNGSTPWEAVAKLRRLYHVDQVLDSVGGSQRAETLLKPVGLAILVVREDSSIKSKAALVEFIFKNLLLGNAVLLSCPPNTLGAKFAFENDHVIPFKMVNESFPDLSRLSLDNSSTEPTEFNDSSLLAPNKKLCPKNTYAIEILPEMNSETFQMLTIALGTRRKTILHPEADQTNYWAAE